MSALLSPQASSPSALSPSSLLERHRGTACPVRLSDLSFKHLLSFLQVRSLGRPTASHHGTIATPLSLPSPPLPSPPSHNCRASPTLSYYHSFRVTSSLKVQSHLISLPIILPPTSPPLLPPPLPSPLSSPPSPSPPLPPCSVWHPAVSTRRWSSGGQEDCPGEVGWA